jgi:hypothetical protein
MMLDYSLFSLAFPRECVCGLFRCGNEALVVNVDIRVNGVGVIREDSNLF